MIPFLCLSPLNPHLWNTTTISISLSCFSLQWKAVINLFTHETIFVSEHNDIHNLQSPEIGLFCLFSCNTWHHTQYLRRLGIYDRQPCTFFSVSTSCSKNVFLNLVKCLVNTHTQLHCLQDMIPVRRYPLDWCLVGTGFPARFMKKWFF